MPLNWISHGLWHDHNEKVNFQFFSDLEDGIDTSLRDLLDFNEWREVMEDIVIQDDLVGF